MIKSIKTILSQDKEKFVVPKKVQDLIPIKCIWPDGIFKVGNKFSKTYKFSDINYMVASREDKESMFLTYSELLNSLDSGATTKITINNHRLNKADFEDSILMPMKRDGLDGYRMEYNNMLLDIIEAQESVLFIDDAYSLLDKSDDNNYPKEAIDEIVAAMTNTKQYHFCMIMAGYPEPMDELLKMNSGLSSRFSKANILTIEDYPPELLKTIFVNNCRKDGYRFWGDEEGEEDPLDLDLFFKNMYEQRDRANFGNARDVVSVAREAKMQSSLRDDEERCIKKEDFGSYLKYFEQHGVSSIDDIYAEIDQYVGLEFVKELFDNVRLEILDVEDCKRRGVKPDSYPDHYIFAGNPGTGKTTVGKMIGEFYHLMGVMGGAETLFVDASELIGNHVGDSKNKIISNTELKEVIQWYTS